MQGAGGAGKSQHRGGATRHAGPPVSPCRRIAMAVAVDGVSATLLVLVAIAACAASPEPADTKSSALLLSSSAAAGDASAASSSASTAAAVCAACAAACAAAAASAKGAPSNSKEATATPKPQLLFVDEDSHEDAIKESKGGTKVGVVPEIVSFAGYKGITLDDLPVDPEYSPSAPFWTRTDSRGTKPSWAPNRLQGGSQVPVWAMRRGGAHERWGPYEQTLPYGLSGGGPTYWRPSTPPRRSPGVRGGSSQWCPPKPINPPYNPPYNPPQNPPYNPPYNPSRPLNPSTPRPTYPLVPPSPKPVLGVEDKLDWSDESGEDGDKKGNGQKDDDKKVIAVVDKLDLDSFSR